MGRAGGGRSRLPALAFLSLLLPGQVATRRAPERTLAVIVHPKNETQNLTFEELRAFFTLERQFWPAGRRVSLLLRPSGSSEQKVLLETVYRMTEKELRKYWSAKIFAGQIPALPSVIGTTAKTAAEVKGSEGAISVVLASEIPEGVRVLSIDRKRPGDPGYRLAIRPTP